MPPGTPDTRDRTLDAAAQLLRDEGPAALTVRRIASAAGLSTMAIYHHFGGKDGLVEALYVDGFAALEAALAAVPRTDDPIADVEALALAYREVAMRRPGYYEVMFGRPFPGFEPTAEAQARAMRPWRAFTDALERCEAAGLLTAPARRRRPAALGERPRPAHAAARGQPARERRHRAPHALGPALAAGGGDAPRRGRLTYPSLPFALRAWRCSRP